jgi:hypothetical protein
MIKSITKNSVLAENFKMYCDLHPDERFYQALKNWSGAQFILTAQSVTIESGKKDVYNDVEDTYNWEEKNK